MLFSDLEIYGMFCCSQYCVIIPLGLPLGGKFTLTSNISSLIKGLYDRSILNVGMVELFVPGISSEPV